MRTNTSKAMALAGKPALGTMCNAASPLIGEWLGHSGYDFVVVDLQHGENNLDSVQVMLQALSSTPAIPVVRVPANVPMYIQRVLDLGAYGVIVPLVNTRAEAEAVAASVRYAPKGVELGMNITVTKGNYLHLEALAQLAWDLGLRWINIQFLTPFGRATKWIAPALSWTYFTYGL